MNCTKLTIPSSISLNIYYYYSFFTLFLSLLITPLQFYIILTKSDDLKNFKWLILNRSFWCLAFEIFFTTVKPVFFVPALGGFPLGLLRNGNITTTITASYIGCVIFLTQCCALATTVLNRYLYAFPSKLSNSINMKYALFFFAIAFITAITILTISLLPHFSIDNLEAYKSAIEFEPCLEAFSSEPALLFLPSSKTTSICLFIAFAGCCVALTGILGVLCFFIFLVFYHKATLTIAKLQRSLIISAILQIFITLIFLFFPLFCCIVAESFQISTSSHWVIIASCITVSHSFLESLATLYFVSPYLKAVKEILGYLFPYFKTAIKPIQISQASGTMRY